MKLVAFLKNLCSMNFLMRVRYFPSFFKTKELKVNSTSKRIFYLDAPDYSNIGDQAIALAIKCFASKHFPDYEFVEILQKDIFKYIKSVKKQINKDDVIFLTGGGNMGNVYKMFEATRRFVIKTFPDNKIIVFPQTIEYTNDLFGRISCRQSTKVYSAHKHLFLCARERFSYEKMKEHYPTTEIILCPDIVLSLDKCYNENVPTGVSLCLRNDCEMSLSDADREYIKSILKKENQSTREISTISDIKMITDKNRERVVCEKLKDFSFSDLVVTDRLHAMIFCFLTDTPCIVFGNTNHKIEGVYEFISNIPYIRFLKQVSDFPQAVQDTTRIVPEQYKVEEMDFNTIVKVVRED